MKGKKQILFCYGNSQKTVANTFRPETSNELREILNNHKHSPILSRGGGLSYSDVCLNSSVILTERLNHLLRLNENDLSSQPGVTLLEILKIFPDKTLPVIPGTLRATLGGGVANDVHGKNNYKEGNLGHHIQSMKLVIPGGSVKISPTEHRDLFYATIGGLGLTGFIEEITLSLVERSKAVKLRTQAIDDIAKLLKRLQDSNDDYAVSWLDLLNGGRFLLMEASHIEQTINIHHTTRQIPFKSPVNLVYDWNMKWFNKFYYRKHPSQESITDIVTFNNPLDTIQGWEGIYGQRGMIQFQCLFPFNEAEAHFRSMLKIINQHGATPILAVLKKFNKHGKGLLSFTEPGFSIAIDFVNSEKNIKAVKELNSYITDIKGKIYLAKDNFLTKEQFESMYNNVDSFKNVLEKYKLNSLYQSKLSQRLGLTQ